MCCWIYYCTSTSEAPWPRHCTCLIPALFPRSPNTPVSSASEAGALRHHPPPSLPLGKRPSSAPHQPHLPQPSCVLPVGTGPGYTAWSQAASSFPSSGALQPYPEMPQPSATEVQNTVCLLQWPHCMWTCDGTFSSPCRGGGGGGENKRSHWEGDGNFPSLLLGNYVMLRTVHQHDLYREQAACYS